MGEVRVNEVYVGGPIFLKPQAKFQYHRITPSWRKESDGEPREKKTHLIVDT